MGLKEFMRSVPRGNKKHVLAQIADAAGVTPSCIKHYVNGTRNCPAWRAKRIESALGGKVTAHEIVFGEKLKTDSNAA